MIQGYNNKIFPKTKTNKVPSQSVKYLVVLKVLGTSYLCYNNIFISKLWDPSLSFSNYTWFLDTVLHVLITLICPVFNVLLSILNSLNIPTSFILVFLESIQSSHSEHLVLQTLLCSFNPLVQVLLQFSSLTIEYPNIVFNSSYLTLFFPMSTNFISN